MWQSHADVDTDGDCYCHCFRYRNSDSNGNCYTDGNFYGYCHGNGYRGA